MPANAQPPDRRSAGSEERRRRIPAPLDRAGLEELALSYVARFATSAARLERYLARKLRERGWDGEGAGEGSGGGEGKDEGGAAPDIAAIVARHVGLGHIDDAAFARGKAGSLLRRGYGPRRVAQALGEAGIAAAIRHDIAPDEAARRRAALALARKRRFGPFGGAPPDRAAREKQIAAMLRAGHMLADARELVDAPSEDAATRWADEAEDEASHDES